MNNLKKNGHISLNSINHVCYDFSKTPLVKAVFIREHIKIEADSQ